MMNIKPWREIARPHRDVLEDTFRQAEFAANISQVSAGTAPPEYQDPVTFFSRSFITEDMRLLLIYVARRLSCRGGDPVVQLQTAFGGCKTHTLLAVMHLAGKKVPFESMEGIPPHLIKCQTILSCHSSHELSQGRQLNAVCLFCIYRS